MNNRSNSINISSNLTEGKVNWNYCEEIVNSLIDFVFLSIELDKDFNSGSNFYSFIFKNFIAELGNINNLVNINLNLKRANLKENINKPV